VRKVKVGPITFKERHYERVQHSIPLSLCQDVENGAGAITTKRKRRMRERDAVKRTV